MSDDQPDPAKPIALPPPAGDADTRAPRQNAAPPAASPPRPLPARNAGNSRSALAVFAALGFLVLAFAGFYLWHRVDELARNEDPVRVTVLESQVRLLQQRLAQLEQAPPPAVPPVPAVTPAPTVDLGPIERRLASVEQRPQPAAPDLSPLEQRLAAVERRPPPAPPADLAPLSGRLESLERKLVQGEAQAGQSLDRSGRIARLQAAGIALDAGQPLGEIPGAGTALSRFAVTRPPTEASLRLAFPEAARAAIEASRPDIEGRPLTERMWLKMTGLVTVRAGDRVIVGAPSTVVLADAQRKLDAGDVAGAVASLDRLDAKAAAAMADWRGQAQALLDAHAALAAMARG